MGGFEKHSTDELIGESAKNNEYTFEMMFAEFGDLVSESSFDLESETATEREGLRERETRLRLFEDLSLDLRWANRLENAGIVTVGDLCGRSVEDLLSLKGVGHSAIIELEKRLQYWELPTLQELAYFKPPQSRSVTPSSFKPFAEDVFIDYMSGPSSYLELGEWRQRFFGELPYMDDPEGNLIEKYDDIPLCDIPGLYELIPYPHNLYLGKQESVSSLLTSSLEHMITDFGFTSASSIIDCLICNFGEFNELDEVLERYAAEIKRNYPSELLCIPLAWLFPCPDDSLFQFGNVGELFGENKSILSVYLAQALEEALQRLFANNSAPYRIDALFMDAFDELNCGCDSRAKEIYIKRNGLGESRKTLEEVGRELDITRERVRQIESKTQERFDPLKSERLLLLRLAMFNIAKEIGSTGPIDDLCRSFVSHGLFETDADCVGFLELLPEYSIDRAAESFVLPGYPCINCNNAIAVITDIVSHASCRTHEEFIEHVGCKYCKVETALNISVFDHCKGVRVSSEYIGAPSNPVMRASLKPTSERALLHAILYEADRALSYDEMIDQVYQACGNKPSKNKVGSQVGSFSDCMLWGRGTYIHEKNAPYPEELLKIISDLIVDVFDINQIPIVGVEGIFSKFADQLLEQGIPTHHALYSLLRRYSDPRLKLQEYPWICDVSSIGERTSFAKYFYSILEDNNGFITDEHARTIADKTMAQSFALGGLAEYSPFVINANGGWYDIGTAGFDMEGIASLAEEVAGGMRDNDIVSAVKVFEEYRERCFKYGVKSHDMLYYLVDMMEDNLPIEATRRPHFVKSEQKGLSAISVMRMYIEEADKPVSKDELYEEFVTKRRLNLRGICGSLLVNKEIIDIGNDRYWSRSKLAMDDEFIESVEAVIGEQISRSPSRRIANLFVALDSVIPSLSVLPQPSGIAWNTSLLRTALSKGERFRLFGESNNCLVNLQNNPGVTDVESFFKALLDNEFYGWSPFESFANYCKAHSIHSHIEPEFFDAFSLIEADEGSIQTL